MGDKILESYIWNFVSHPPSHIGCHDFLPPSSHLLLSGFHTVLLHHHNTSPINFVCGSFLSIYTTDTYSLVGCHNSSIKAFAQPPLELHLPIVLQDH